MNELERRATDLITVAWYPIAALRLWLQAMSLPSFDQSYAALSLLLTLLSKDEHAFIPLKLYIDYRPSPQSRRGLLNRINLKGLVLRPCRDINPPLRAAIEGLDDEEGFVKQTLPAALLNDHGRDRLRDWAWDVTAPGVNAKFILYSLLHLFHKEEIKLVWQRGPSPELTQLCLSLGIH